MQASNNASRSQRVSESGLVYEEKLTNAMGTLNLYEHQTFRVRATGATTVTIEGILAATMMSGEIMIFNAGNEFNNVNADKRVQVVIAGAPAFVQVARIKERKTGEE